MYGRRFVLYEVAIAISVLASSVCLAQERQAVAVMRDDSGDLVTETLRSGECMNYSCNPPSNTYLVETEECRPDTELQQMCQVKLVPQITDDTTSTDSISTFIGENGSLMVLDSATNQYGVGRIFNHLGERQNEMNNCAVTRLSTRGRTLAHDGFFVNIARGEIKLFVAEDDLTYPRSDYDGELYLMNISCSNGAIDCVVFKLNGTIDVTQGKFGEAVPPQQLNITNYCSPATTMPPITTIPSTTPTTTSSNTTSTTTTPTTTEEPNFITSILNNPILGYTTIGSVASAVILICLIIQVGGVACYKNCSRTAKTDVSIVRVNRAHEMDNIREQESIVGYNAQSTGCLPETKPRTEELSAFEDNPAYLTYTKEPTTPQGLHEYDVISISHANTMASARKEEPTYENISKL